MMNDLSFSLPMCTPDSGGAASMLTELGGLLVIHDAAGCMENYIVFDEPRWFDGGIMTYSSSLKQMDAILGNDEPLIADVTETAQKLAPAFITIIGTPVPAVIGMDLDGIAAEIEFRSGIPAFSVDATGFDPYVSGAGKALDALVRRFAEGGDVVKGRVNVLGATPLDLSREQLDTVVQRLERAGWTVNGTFCMDDTALDKVALMGTAERNVVISEAGMAAAKRLKRRFGTPWVRCFPLTDRQARLDPEAERPAPTTDERILILGEPVFGESLADVLTRQRGAFAETLPDWMTENELMERMEEKWDLIIADPLVQCICPKDVPFFAWPRRGMSSHIYDPKALDTLETLFSRH